MFICITAVLTGVKLIIITGVKLIIINKRVTNLSNLSDI